MSAATPEISARAAWRFVVLLGIVSLFADLTYEGARSSTGPFLAELGATGTAVGIIAGLGELLGYGLRLVSGLLADRTGRYWLITIAGYAVNVLAVPLLALAGRWEAAAGLIVAERVGKALRTPARDAMLSHATHVVGHGRGFGLHEALDQVGAVGGPLIITMVLYLGGGYRAGFAILAVPAVLALAALAVACALYPRPHDLEPLAPPGDTRGFPRLYWIYLLAASLVAAGYADFPLIAFHFGRTGSVPAGVIPLLYALAMGVDAIASLAFGSLYDRFGLGVVIVAVLLSAGFAPWVFLGGLGTATVGMILWGIGMGAQESILRAAIAGMVPRDRRGTAYGVFNAAYGLSWFLGSAAMGRLYDRSVPGVAALSVGLQLAALPVLLLVVRQGRSRAA
jgi:MFS family permease